MGELNYNLLRQKELFSLDLKELVKLVIELYQLTNLILEPTGITLISTSLVDHILTNAPDKVLKSCVNYSGINDHC